jgi:cystathionine beta-synthase
MVVLLPDGGRGYLGKVFNDRWMLSHGFLASGDGPTVSDALRRQDGETPVLPHVHVSDTVRDAIRVMGENGLTRLPVLGAEPPVVMGEVLGAIGERTLLDLLANGDAKPTDAVEGFLEPPLGLLGIHESLDAARDALADADVLLVAQDGKPVSLMTRHDILDHLCADSVAADATNA